MTAESQKAIATLVQIAEDKEKEPDTRIRAACSILDFEKFQQANAK